MVHHDSCQVVEEPPSGGGSVVNCVRGHVQSLEGKPDHRVQLGAREGGEVEAF